MREIKFRAWDKNKKGFINGFNMIGFSIGQGAPNQILQRFSDKWNEVDFELMQYTGINDINETEIYESDIIQEMDSVSLQTVTSEVYWSDKGYWALRDKKGKFVDLLHRAELPEVIGNIYVNPELLKEDKHGKDCANKKELTDNG